MTDTQATSEAPLPVAAIEQAGEKLARARAEIGKRIIGQDDVVSLSLTTILSGGHALLVGVPGLAKTRLVDTLGTVLGLNANRIQFTPDLMPSDILGAEVLEDGRGRLPRVQASSKVRSSAQLLMADEINRAGPRTQSALLQAMQEHRVTVAGEDRPLSEPFHVLATQNPIEQEGTYPLPEAQLDRFLLQIDVNYPDRDEERAILVATTGVGEAKAEPVLTGSEIIEMQRIVRAMPVGDSVVDAILNLVRSARPGEPEAADAATKRLAWGPGPRAAQALMLTVRARALLEGRLAPSIEDVRALAHAALAHRMALSFAARAEGASISGVIDELLAQTHLEAVA